MNKSTKHYKNIKDAISRNTMISFGISISSLLVFLLSLGLSSEPVYELYAPLKKVKNVTEILQIFKEKSIPENMGGSGRQLQKAISDINKSSNIKAIKEDSAKKIILDLNLPPDIAILESPELEIPEINSELVLAGIGEGFGNGQKQGKGTGTGDGRIVSRLPSNGIGSGESMPDVNDFIDVDKNAEVDYKDLQNNVHYPEEARRMRVEGKVTVVALISVSGEVIKVKTLGSVNSYLEDEAIRVVREANFTPAEKNGKAVYSWVTIPVVFKLR